MIKIKYYQLYLAIYAPIIAIQKPVIFAFRINQKYYLLEEK